MKNDFPRFTGDFAKSYEKNLGPFLFEPFAKEIVKRINIEKTNSVLEIACGTGRVTRHLRKQLPHPVQLTATDLSEDMMTIAINSLNDDSIRFKTADAQDLPFSNSSFDLVICQFGIMFFPDKAKAFSEFFRVLKPGGELLFSTWDKIEKNHIVHYVHKKVSEFFENDPPDFYKIPFSMHDENELKSLMYESGFKNIETDFVNLEGVGKSLQDLLFGMIKGNPICKEISDKDPEAPDRIITELEKEISVLFGSNPLRSELNALISKSVK